MRVQGRCLPNIWTRTAYTISQMPSGYGEKRASFFGWVPFKGNPSQKKVENRVPLGNRDIISLSSQNSNLLTKPPRGRHKSLLALLLDPFLWQRILGFIVFGRLKYIPPQKPIPNPSLFRQTRICLILFKEGLRWEAATASQKVFKQLRWDAARAESLYFLETQLPLISPS